MNGNSNTNSVGSTASNASSRLTEFVGNTPIYTIILLALNISIHIIVFVTSYPVNELTFSPYHIYYKSEYYRVITSAFLHGGIMHIGMNMMSLVALGGILEPNYGTLKFFYLT